MLLDPLTQVTIQSSENPRLTWAEGMQFCLPGSILIQGSLSEYLDQAGNLIILPHEQLDIDSTAVETLRLRSAFTDHQPLSSRLPVSYQTIPPRFRSWMASLMGRRQRRKVNQWAKFPQWPLDLSADFLADLASYPSIRFDELTPVILTHDLDSAEGLQNLVRWFLEREEAVGARSTSYIVPCAWPIDHQLLQQVKDRGHDLGIHGYDHSNKTPFCGPEEQRERLQAAQILIEQYHICGYRAPSLLRTRSLLKSLVEFYQYDTTIPTSGGLFPIPNNGCASARPFWIEGIMELPLSMPRDGSLRFLGYSPEEILKLWIECAKQIAKSGGVVVLLTHCEARFSGNPQMLSIYRQFLEFIATSRQFTWSMPNTVLEKILKTGSPLH